MSFEALTKYGLLSVLLTYSVARDQGLASSGWLPSLRHCLGDEPPSLEVGRSPVQVTERKLAEPEPAHSCVWLLYSSRQHLTLRSRAVSYGQVSQGGLCAASDMVTLRSRSRMLPDSSVLGMALRETPSPEALTGPT